MWFKTRLASNEKDVVITLLHEKDNGKTDLVYTIDAENDIIKDIRFDVQKETRGSLIFSHLQDIDQGEQEYGDPPAPHEPDIPLQEGPGILWLVSLAQGNLGK